MQQKVTRARDVRKGARLTGRKPLAYDRHADPIFDDDTLDVGAEIGNRWLARRDLGVR